MSTSAGGSSHPAEDPHADEGRAARRAQLGLLPHPVLPPLAQVLRPVCAGAAIGAAGLLALTGWSGPLFLAAAVALLGLVVAAGWPTLLGSSSRYGASLTIAVGALGTAGAVAFTPDDPYLRHAPPAVAVAFLVMFVHQLVRRDGRPRLTESVVITAAGLAMAVIGACWIPFGRIFHGEDFLSVSAAGMAAGALADLLVTRRHLVRWTLPVSMLLGGAAGLGTSLALVDPAPARAALFGLGAAGIGHALRRVLSTQPAISGLMGQLAAAAASVLTPGAVIFAVTRYFYG